MDKFEQGKRNFLIVRDRLKSKVEFRCACLRCYSHPYKFYREHTPEEAIEILINECDHCKEIFSKTGGSGNE